MASGGGKGGKGGNRDSDDQVKWLARDCRQEFGGPAARPGAKVHHKPKPRKGPECRNCEDICCGVSRALISEAFDLGAITVSHKVSLGLIIGVGI